MDLDNFIIGKTEERRGEGRFGEKSNSYLANIERKMCKKSSCCFPNIEDRKAGGPIRSSCQFWSCCAAGLEKSSLVLEIRMASRRTRIQMQNPKVWITA